jgi:hypothetical protein
MRALSTYSDLFFGSVIVHKTLILAAALSLLSTAALADGYNKGAYTGTSAPGSPLAVDNTDYEDKNGDGCLDATEIKPGSQLAKRLQTRDHNHDGKLCKDEYYFN